jgi:hypothetical protein
MLKSVTYNGDGTITDNSEYEYEYDADGNVTKSTYYYNGKFKECYEHDANGATTKKMYMGKNGQLYTGFEAECDSNGNYLKEYEYDSKGAVSATVEYIYE